MLSSFCGLSGPLDKFPARKVSQFHPEAFKTKSDSNFPAVRLTMSKSYNVTKKEPYLCKLWKARSTKLPITNNIKDLKSGVRTKTWRGAKTRWPLARCEVIAPWRTVADCWLDPHHSYCHQQPPPAPLPLSMLSGCPVPPSSHTYNGPTGCLFIIGHRYLEKMIVFPKERRVRQHTVDAPW